MKKALIIISAVFIVLGILLFAGALYIAEFDFSKFDKTIIENKTYTVSKDFKSIEINSKETDIDFIASEDGENKIIYAETEKIKYEISLQNGVLYINSKDDREWYDHITLFSKPLKITVYVTSDKFDTVNISCRTGNINIKNINVDTMNINVSTGDVKLSNINCGKITSNGSTGDLYLENTVATELVKVKRSTGDVKFNKSDAGEIYIKTSTGDVTGTILSDKVFKAKTSTGTVQVPNSESGGKCEITTSTGDIFISMSK